MTIQEKMRLRLMHGGAMMRQMAATFGGISSTTSVALLDLQDGLDEMMPSKLDFMTKAWEDTSRLFEMVDEEMIRIAEAYEAGVNELFAEEGAPVKPKRRRKK